MESIGNAILGIIGVAFVLYIVYALCNNTLWAVQQGRTGVEMFKGRHDPSIVRHTSAGDVTISIVRDRRKSIVAVTSRAQGTKVFGSYPTLEGATFVVHLIAESDTALTDQRGSPLW